MAHSSPWLWTAATAKLAQYTVCYRGSGHAAAGRILPWATHEPRNGAAGGSMAHIVILGAGLGGMPMAYEMRELARDATTRSPSSPTARASISCRAIRGSPSTGGPGQNIELDIGPSLKRKGIDFVPVGAKRLHAAENRIELDDGNSVAYDYLVIATGPEARVRRNPRPRTGRGRRPHAVDLPRRPRGRGRKGLAGSSSRIPGRSSSAPCRARPATARRTNSR